MKFKLDPLLSAYTNNQMSIEVRGNTVGECLSDLNHQFPDLDRVIFDKDGKLNSFIGVFMNGKDSLIEHLFRPVKNGDELSVVFSSGGC